MDAGGIFDNKPPRIRVLADFREMDRSEKVVEVVVESVFNVVPLNMLKVLITRMLVK